MNECRSFLGGSHLPSPVEEEWVWKDSPLCSASSAGGLTREASNTVTLHKLIASPFSSSYIPPDNAKLCSQNRTLAAMASAPAHHATGEYLYEYHGLKLVVLAAFFIPLEIIFVLLRTWSRTLSDAKMGLDDILIWPSLVLCLAINIIGFGMKWKAPAMQLLLLTQAK